MTVSVTLPWSPLASVTVRLTEYEPGAEKLCTGSAAVDVSAAPEAGSPNDHCHVVIGAPPTPEVDVLVKATVSSPVPDDVNDAVGGEGSGEVSSPV